MTVPYAYQLKGARLIDRFGGRCLLADEMGCIHPSTPLKCHKSADVKTAAGWCLSGVPPWLLAYAPNGSIVCRQPSEMVIKTPMPVLQINTESGLIIAVGIQHKLLILRNGAPDIVQAAQLRKSDKLAIIKDHSQCQEPATTENTFGTSVISARSTPSKKHIGLALSSEMDQYIDKEQSKGRIGSNLNYALQIRTNNILNNSARTFAGMAPWENTGLETLLDGKCHYSEPASATTSLNLEWMCEARDLEQPQTYDFRFADISGGESLTPMDRFLLTGTKREIQAYSALHYATHRLLFWRDLDSFSTEWTSPRLRLSEDTERGKSLLEETEQQWIWQTYSTTGLPDSYQERQAYSEWSGSITDELEGHFIPASFQNISWQQIKHIGSVGSSSVVDLTMPGLGNYFDAAGINHQNCGKTLQTLLYAHRNPELRPIVVVCPAFLKLNWERECKTHFNFRAEVLWTTKPPKEGLGHSSSIYIINYEVLWAWIDCLKATGPKVIIADECHFVKSRSAKRTKALRALCKGVPHVIAISGTPLTNRPAELWPSLNIIRPDLFPHFWPYAEQFCGVRHTPWGWTYSGATRLTKLHKMLADTCMIRRTKAEVLKDLPKKRRFTVPLPLSNPEDYELAKENFLEWMYKNKPGKLDAAKRAERLSQMSYLRQLAGQLKLDAVCNWVSNFLAESDEKIILFAWHTDLINKLHQKFPKLSVIVDGSVTGVKRQKAIDQFLHNKKTRILIGNIKAAGVGWSAKGVSTVAFVEYSFVPGDHTQAEDRVHGIGRGAEGVRSLVYYLCSPETIEAPLLEIIQKKQKVLTSVLDGTGKGETLPVHDLLHEALLKQRRLM